MRFAIVTEDQPGSSHFHEVFAPIFTSILFFDQLKAVDVVFQLGNSTRHGQPHLDQNNSYFNELVRLDQAGIDFVPLVGPKDYDRDFSPQMPGRQLAAFNRLYESRNQQLAQIRYQADSIANVAYFADKLIFLVLDYCPDDQVRAWARQLLWDHQDQAAVVMTHDYRGPDGPQAGATDLDRFVQANSRALWQELISPSPNVRLVLAGHRGQASIYKQVDLGQANNLVTQVFCNWQSENFAGEGRYGLVDIEDDLVTIKVCNPVGQTIEGLASFSIRESQVMADPFIKTARYLDLARD
ncbi:hypothetical protein AWM75_07685 [Aerococcus urinaehominis]|uniref:Uncharacterized protein n=1 Tax=Aerococcus urinaehominis TaxID=128944 RepID=A0A0X8FM47_9LACT|nr:hypothetical protein [Aerococcus urinaehominis]AMB99853.1 hypothetical protein AWM75_07685 [Aerococcus urinaehominis]SDM64400.1 hypothetical protein SAMN04487985_1373 [Aerococcus urinaehominis]